MCYLNYMYSNHIHWYTVYQLDYHLSDGSLRLYVMILYDKSSKTEISNYPLKYGSFLSETIFKKCNIFL